jgi:hypothetical protein
VCRGAVGQKDHGRRRTLRGVRALTLEQFHRGGQTFAGGGSAAWPQTLDEGASVLAVGPWRLDLTHGVVEDEDPHAQLLGGIVEKPERCATNGGHSRGRDVACLHRARRVGGEHHGRPLLGHGDGRLRPSQRHGDGRQGRAVDQERQVPAHARSLRRHGGDQERRGEARGINLAATIGQDVERRRRGHEHQRKEEERRLEAHGRLPS